MLDIFVCPTGGSLEQKMQAKMRSLKSRASEILKLGRTNSQMRQQPIDEDPVLSIPLGSLLRKSNGSAQLSGCFYINANENPGSAIVGEMSVHVVASPDSFTAPAVEEAPLARFTHCQYLTIQESRHWKRYHAVLDGRDLHLQDFELHHKLVSATIDLDSVIELEYLKEHICGVENVFRVRFENGHEILAYADNEMQGLEWADKVHRAVWNQPYIIATQ
ncbi:hypothetical protein PSACC_00064 [Paramicrosporidium saccamoebae]|uniref:PH domain-containing protein n=1 Tax=Paramicrosporidium saccamoebae TaxID=1246581 RepID=A0A2H9TQV7_9FUNG|nr:hypothetical protein PSACC_00064 [Paramicrosporidium saccamoebae]